MRAGVANFLTAEQAASPRAGHARNPVVPPRSAISDKDGRALATIRFPLPAEIEIRPLGDPRQAALGLLWHADRARAYARVMNAPKHSLALAIRHIPVFPNARTVNTINFTASTSAMKRARGIALINVYYFSSHVSRLGFIADSLPDYRRCAPIAGSR